MLRPLYQSILTVAAVLAVAAALHAFPKPSPYPITWELKFDHSLPKRMIITPRGAGGAEAYWYMTFTVTNFSNREQTFLPVFELLTSDGQVIRSDKLIPPEVLQTIRIRERNRHLQAMSDIATTLRVGEDQARDGVAIWREPDPRMGRFSIFVTGLSGEATILKDSKGSAVEKTTPDGKKQPVVLWKTLEMAFHMAGDEKYPGIDVVDLVEQRWVMR